MRMIGTQGALPMGMKITVTATEEVTTIALAGELAGHAATLQPAFATAIAEPTAKVVIDLTACTSLGVDGLGLVYGAYRSLPWAVELELHARPPFARLLRLCFGRCGRGNAPARQTPVLPPEAIVEVP